MLLWLPRGRFAEVTRGSARMLVLGGLLTILFLFPLTAHYLGQLVGGSEVAQVVRWLPTFWFLGVYDCIMWGGRVPSVFHHLASIGVLVTSAALLTACVSYPIGYTRRVRHLVEGSPLSDRRASSGRLQSMLHRLVFRTPQMRATAHLAAQTLLRIERLHLYLAMYAGLGAALVLSGVLALRVESSRVAVVFQAGGLPTAVPLVAFWTVAGLSTATRSPVAKRGSWVFRVIGGAPGQRELGGGRRLTVCAAWLTVLCTVFLLDACAPQGVPGRPELVVQVLFGCGLPLVLAEVFFANTRTVPFTGAARRSVHTLPLTLVRYFVLLPAFVLATTAFESWAATSASRMVCAAFLLGGAYGSARVCRVWLTSRPAPTDELTLVTLHED